MSVHFIPFAALHGAASYESRRAPQDDWLAKCSMDDGIATYKSRWALCNRQLFKLMQRRTNYKSRWAVTYKSRWADVGSWMQVQMFGLALKMLMPHGSCLGACTIGIYIFAFCILCTCFLPPMLDSHRRHGAMPACSIPLSASRGSLRSLGAPLQQACLHVRIVCHCFCFCLHPYRKQGHRRCNCALGKPMHGRHRQCMRKHNNRVPWHRGAVFLFVFLALLASQQPYGGQGAIKVALVDQGKHVSPHRDPYRKPLFEKVVMAMAMNPQHRLHAEGIEPHPGPQPQDDLFYLEIINCTAASTRLPLLLGRKAHGLLITEHSCNPQMVSECREQCRDARWASEFSCRDPELCHITGGVAALVRQPARLFPIEPSTKGLKDCMDNGRLGLYAMDIGQDTMGICFIVYGWTGGHGFNEASARTNACFKAIRGEVAARPGELICCGGDFNSSPEFLPDLLALMEDHHWVDIGARLNRYSQYILIRLDAFRACGGS